MNPSRQYILRDHLQHSENPYIHKYCGCIHLRMGAAISCLLWAGLSLYFAIESFQARSPIYTNYLDNTALYIFGTANLILFGVSLGSLVPLCLELTGGIRVASAFINVAVFVVLIDMTANTIYFIAGRDTYVQNCANGSNSENLDKMLNLSSDQQFNSKSDFYNCNRAWGDEWKFAVLCTIVMIFVYVYWAFSIISYTVKLRMKVRRNFDMWMVNPNIWV